MKRCLSNLTGLIALIFYLLFCPLVFYSQEKWITQLISELEDFDETVRTAAANEIVSRGEKAQKQALEKIIKRQNQVIEEYKKARYKILDDIPQDKIDTKLIDTKRKEALKLFEAESLDEMKKVVEEMREKFYPKLPPAEEHDKDKVLATLSGKIKVLNGSLGLLGSKVEAAEAQIKVVNDAIDTEFQWKSMPAKDQNVMKQNEKVKNELDIEEYRFVVILNKYRVLMCKTALPINLKLCKAARGHSTDMKERNFFDHYSPVPGKRTPEDRAAKEGTSASAENITQDEKTGEGAFWSWFLSKGHHQNMLRSASQTGIGFYEGFWTNMF